MSATSEPLIVLTNDDGINSPGLLAAAKALDPLGWVLVVAPREQQSGSGRSMLSNADGEISLRRKLINDDQWEMYSVGGSPAQSVQCALFEIADSKPDLVVSGINYGENVGSGTTISGTVGAALEGASFGIPALAVSLEMDLPYHLSHSDEIDFTAPGHFTHMFARILLNMPASHDVDLLKVDVPSDSTLQTPWRVTCQSRQKYWVPIKADEMRTNGRGNLNYRRQIDFESVEMDSDIHALASDRVVSVTPISLDLTSRVDLEIYERRLRDER